MTIQHLYPTTRPSLDLNFARTKRLDPRVTFTRGSTATYVGSDGLIKTAASNEARFDHDPVTGESLGLLIEEARTNYFTNSSLPTGTVNGVKTTVSGYLLPDGTTGNCTQLYVNQVSDNLYDGFNGSVPANTQFHFTFWVQNISGFPVTFSYGRTSYSVVPVTIPNDGKWYKLSGDAGFSNASGQLYNFSYVDTRPGGSTNPVSTPFTVLLWGSQMEAGTFPTSYIPTSGSTVTRAADVASMTGTNFSSWYNQSEGTTYSETRNVPFNGGLWYFGPSGAPRWWSRNELGNGVRTQAYDGSGGSGVVDIVVSGSGSGNIIPSLKHIVTIDNVAQEHAGSANGSSVTTGSWDSISGVSALQLGRRSDLGGNNGYLNGTISRLTYYPTRLTDAQLQALTL